jgi:hypothetical protein
MAESVRTEIASVIDALGGNSVIQDLFEVSPSAVSNWRAAGQFPATTYVAFQALLVDRTVKAPARLWGMRGFVGPIPGKPRRRAKKTPARRAPARPRSAA